MSEYLGLYKGLVVDNNDPERRGRVILHVPQVLGDAVTSWCEPNLPTISKPAVNDPVYVQFLNGDVAKPVYYSSEVLRVENISAGTITVEMLDFAPSGVTTFHTEAGDTSVPLASAPGDLWIDGNNGNVTKRWDGSAWVEFQVSGEAVAPGGIVGTHITNLEVSTPKLAANAVTADKLEATMVLGTTLSTRTLDGSGNLIGAGLDLTPEGLTSYDAGGKSRVEIPNDPTLPAVFRGDAEIDHLTVSTLTTLQNSMLAQGSALALQSTVAAPTNPPTVSTGYTQVQHTEVSSTRTSATRLGLAYDGTSYYTLIPAGTKDAGFTLEKWSAAGVRTASYTYSGDAKNQFYAQPCGGLVYNPTTNRISALLFGTAVGGFIAYSIWSWDPANLSTPTGQYNVQGTTAQYPEASFDAVYKLTSRVPALGYDYGTSQFLVAQSRSANGDKVRVHRLTGGLTNTGVFTSFVDTTDVYGDDLSTLLYGNFDLGSAHYVYGNYGSSQLRTVTAATGVLDTANQWDHGVTALRRGATWTGWGGITGNFVLFDASGLRTTYEAANKWTTSADATWYAAYSWRDSVAPSETLLSPVATFTMRKRARLTVRTASLVTGTTEARVYLAKGTSAPNTGVASMTLSGSTTGTTNPVRTEVAAAFSPLNNPNPVTQPASFPPASAAALQSVAADSAGPLVNLKGDGSGRVGPWSWDINSNMVTRPAPADTGWVNLPSPTDWPTGSCQYRVVDGRWLLVQFPGGTAVKATAVSVTNTGSITDEVFGASPNGIPSQYRILAPSANFPIVWGGMPATVTINNIGEVRISTAEATGSARTIAASAAISGKSAAFLVGA